MNQRGFLLPVIAILILFVAVGGGAFFLGRQSSSPQTVPVVSPSPEKKEFTIPEVGIKFPTATIDDFTYSLGSGGTAGKGTSISFSTKTLEAKGGEYCAAKTAPLGIVTVQDQLAVQEPDGQHVPPLLVQVGGKYIYYTHPQATCSDEKAIQELAAIAMGELQEQLKQSEVTELKTLSKSINADWKTFTTSDFSIQYPAEMRTPQSEEGYFFELWGPTQKDGTEFYDGINIGISTGSLKGQTIKDIAIKAQTASRENLGDQPVSNLQSSQVNIYRGYEYSVVGLGKMNYIFITNGTKYAKIRYLLNTDPQNKGYQETIDKMFMTFEFNN